jgi:hypothetical protein
MIDDALSAAGLLLAIVALIFSAWQEDISDAIGLQASTDKSKTASLRTKALATLRKKAVPLAIGALLAAAIFGHRAFMILLTLRFATRAGYGFDDIGAAFVLTELFVALIAAVAVRQVFLLLHTISKLGSSV